MYVILIVLALNLGLFCQTVYICNKNKLEVVLTKSKKPDKKYAARIDGSKTVTFGQKGASDFTKHKNPDRKNRYI